MNTPRYALLAGLLLAGLVSVSSCWAQQATATAEINQLEQQEGQAMMRRDTTQLRQLWSPTYVVNNPDGMIVTVPQILAFLRGGQIDYSTLQRIVEKVTVTGDVAVAMGREVITPQRNTSNAGHVVTRRYTDVWQRQGGAWHLLARQATNVEVK